MYKGKTIESADSKDLFLNPNHSYTKQLLSSSRQIENAEFYSKKKEKDILKINNINKYFKLPGTKQKLTAVNDVSFFLKEGEILGIAGESGSGAGTCRSELVARAPVGFGKTGTGWRLDHFMFRLNTGLSSGLLGLTPLLTNIGNSMPKVFLQKLAICSLLPNS